MRTPRVFLQEYLCRTDGAENHGVDTKQARTKDLLGTANASSCARGTVKSAAERCSPVGHHIGRVVMTCMHLASPKHAVLMVLICAWPESIFQGFGGLQPAPRGPSTAVAHPLSPGEFGGERRGGRVPLYRSCEHTSDDDLRAVAWFEVRGWVIYCSSNDANPVIHLRRASLSCPTPTR